MYYLVRQRTHPFQNSGNSCLLIHFNNNLIQIIFYRFKEFESLASLLNLNYSYLEKPSNKVLIKFL
jgi:hypothetical protein